LRVLVALALIAACGVAPVSGRMAKVTAAILGRRPLYGPGLVSSVPNLAALERMIWMPGLDDGWDPQGLAIAGGSVFISAYQSLAAWKDRGPCRVFRVDPQTGRETGHFDVPWPCGHAGGLAYAGRGEFFITDTHNLFEVDLDRAFGDRSPKFRVNPLGPGLKGAFAVSGNGSIWIGDYEEEPPAKAFKFSLAVLDALPDGAVLNTGAASAVVPVPSYAQGGTIGPSGRLWISRSDIDWGVLDRIDPVTGRLEQQYPAPGGIEGLAFDESGRLWCVSEAGARHMPLRYPFFPLIYRLDPARLSSTSPPAE
jgi:sugar lactone lactonase YvrE